MVTSYHLNESWSFPEFFPSVLVFSFLDILYHINWDIKVICFLLHIMIGDFFLQKRKTDLDFYLQPWQSHVNLQSSLSSGHYTVLNCPMVMIHCTVRSSCLTCFPGKEQHTGEVSRQIQLPIPVILPYQQLGMCSIWWFSLSFFSFFLLYHACGSWHD